jgi:predicted ferric reductase
VKQTFAAGVFWVLLALPFLLAVLQVRPAELAAAPAVFDLLGRLTAILGLTCLLLSAVLAVRVPGFDRLFGGLTRLWHLHHRLGGAALVLLLAHPLLMAFAAADASIAAAVNTLFPRPVRLPPLLGWAGLVTMMVVLAPTFAFFGEPEYQRWKVLHRVSGLALLFALGHTFLVSQSLPPPWHVVVWGGLAVLAVAAVSWRLLFASRIARLRYRVEDVAHPANNVVELTLAPEGRALRYRPGQFVYLTPYDRQLESGYGEEHPYTLTSSPREDVLRMAIKDLGDSSRALQHIAPGSPVEIEGPYGDFFPAETGRELWIAGGIGVTPFLGRARYLAGNAAGADVCMIYFVQDEARALFLDELQTIADSIEGFTLALHYFYREGPLAAAYLQAHCPDLGERTAYICGPVPLLALTRRHLLAARVEPERIHSEEFKLL